MTRTEPVAAFSVTGAVVGIIAWAGARYAPGVEVPEEVMVPLVAGIVACVSGLARWWVVPHAKATLVPSPATRETLAADGTEMRQPPPERDTAGPDRPRQCRPTPIQPSAQPGLVGCAPTDAAVLLPVRQADRRDFPVVVPG